MAKMAWLSILFWSFRSIKGFFDFFVITSCGKSKISGCSRISASTELQLLRSYHIAHTITSRLEYRFGNLIRFGDYFAAGRRSLGGKFRATFDEPEIWTPLSCYGSFGLASLHFPKKRSKSLLDYWQLANLTIAPWLPMKRVSSECVRFIVGSRA